MPTEIPDIVNDIQFYGYYDIGAVWGDGFTRSSMASAGGGIRAALIRSIRMQFEATQPLTRSHTPGEESGDDPRFFISLSAQF